MNSRHIQDRSDCCINYTRNRGKIGFCSSYINYNCFCSIFHCRCSGIELRCGDHVTDKSCSSILYICGRRENRSSRSFIDCSGCCEVTAVVAVVHKVVVTVTSSVAQAVIGIEEVAVMVLKE